MILIALCELFDRRDLLRFVRFVKLLKFIKLFSIVSILELYHKCQGRASAIRGAPASLVEAHQRRWYNFISTANYNVLTGYYETC